MVRKQRCVSLDPPWNERGGGKIKRGADKHYPLLKMHDIIRVVYQSGVWNPDPKGCHCWLWVTNNFLDEGRFVMKALGFRYINQLAWGKVKNGKVQKGLGQYFFGSHELCLFGVMGRLKAKERVSTLLLEPRDEHSRKPDEAYRRMETVSPGPRLEMFGRRERYRWRVWGNEIEVKDRMRIAA